MAAIDWTKICKKYKGLWVALKKDNKTVIASGHTLKEAVEKAKKKGYKEPILFRVPTEIIPYIG
jgi:phosphopantetheinyl transferase (holo-ACP synthase)